MKMILRFAVVTMITLLASFTASAEQMKKLGDWNVHYIAFGSTFITPEVAKSYGLTRSKYKGLINISVLSSGKGFKAQKVTISGTARNLLGNQVDLEFKEIVEGKSVYYIAQINYANEENYRFEIDLKQGSKRQKLKFSQQFFVD